VGAPWAPTVKERRRERHRRHQGAGRHREGHANKVEIRQAIERLFKVKVEKVRTSRVLGKTRRVGRSLGRKSDWKKAYVTLAEGAHIDFFEGA
jgi:ribosomal protein L23